MYYIENTTDYSSYLRSIGDDPDSVDPNEPQYYNVDSIPEVKRDYFTNTYSVKYKGDSYEVTLGYPDIKDLHDYFAQGMHECDGIMEGKLEQVIRPSRISGYLDFTEWFQQNETDLLYEADCASERFFKRIKP